MLTELAIKKRAVTLFFCILLLLGGIAAFFSMGWLEDPEFTVKTAAIVTPYPGASAEEVELEVTDLLERALQEMSQVDELYSISRAGLSIIRVDIKSEYWSDRLPQVWDEMRSKIADAQPFLPPGAGEPDIGDDFGFVYGFLASISSRDFAYAELENFAKDFEKELSVIPGVSRVVLWGVQDRVIYVDISQQQFSQLGLTPAELVQTLQQQNMVVDAGSIDSPRQRFRVAPTGTFASPENIGELTIVASQLSRARERDVPTATNRTDQIIRLQDFAEISVGYREPPAAIMRHNGVPSIAFAVSNVAGANVVEVGRAIDKRMNELIAELPIGVEVNKISWQADIVEDSIRDFMVNLIMAIAIVLLILTVPMGFRLGVIIGTSLLFTILGTFLLMGALGIDLHRMSLGALVIALGMMVDNSIVVADGFIVRLQKGMDRVRAATDAATQPSFPLLGATVIAVMAFYPVFASVEDAGEYLRDLFTVVAIALLFSWVISMTLTPLMCIELLPDPKPNESKDAYGGAIYGGFRRLLRIAIGWRLTFIASLVVLLVLAMQLFAGLPQQFFPDSARTQFLIDYWAPEGTRIQSVGANLESIEAKVLRYEGVVSVSSFIGQGPPRFYLPVDSEFPYPSYANLVINTETSADVAAIVADLEPWLDANTPEAMTRVRLYGLGPSDTWPLEARFSGPQEADLAVLRELGEQGKSILEATPLAKEIRTDMRQRVRRLEVDFNDTRARWANIDRTAIADSTRRAHDGLNVGLYREGDTLIPIMVRLVEDERQDLSGLDVLQVAAPNDTRTVALSQVTNFVGFRWEDPLIIRHNRRRAIAVQASPDVVTFPTLHAAVVADFEAIELPSGFDFMWDGEYRSTVEAQQSLIPGVIPAVAIMLFLIIYLFNGFRPAAIILLAIPFIFIGIAPALFATQVPFGFVALLGAMSLSGMMIKNSIVLLDQINIELEEGRAPYAAVVEAAVSRLRPVVLAAATTVLGVIPLLTDVFWVGMAITIMAGLTAGTILTLVLVPSLYALLYRISVPPIGEAPTPLPSMAG